MKTRAPRSYPNRWIPPYNQPTSCKWTIRDPCQHNFQLTKGVFLLLADTFQICVAGISWRSRILCVRNHEFDPRLFRLWLVDVAAVRNFYKQSIYMDPSSHCKLDDIRQQVEEYLSKSLRVTHHSNRYPLIAIQCQIQPLMSSQFDRAAAMAPWRTLIGS
jgi:hypothetical protein